MSAGAEMIWGAWNWLRRLVGTGSPSRGVDAGEIHIRTRTELLSLAKEAGIQGRHRMSKRELVSSLLSPEGGSAPARKAVADSMEELVQRGTSHQGAQRAARPRARISAGATGSPQGQSLERARISIPMDAAVATSTELNELPTSYRSPQLTLLAVEPCRVYAYWDVTAEDRETAVARLGSRGGGSVVWVLRLYDVTYIDFDGTNAHSYFDVPIETTVSGWYVDLWSGEKSYCAEMGPRSPDGRFAPVCRSNFVDLPRAEAAPHYQPEWLSVEGGFDSVRVVPEPPPEDGAPEPSEIIDGEGNLGSAGQQNIETSSGQREPGRKNGEWYVRPGADEGAASVSEATASPPGNGDGVPAADNGEGSIGAVAPGQMVSAGPRMPEAQGRGLPSQVSQKEMSRRYEGLLAGAPRAGGGGETLAHESPGSAAEVALLEIHVERRHRISASSHGVSSFGSGGILEVPGSQSASAIDLKLNAEVVISGRAQPGQTVQVNGRWLKVGADGTFSLRLALPVVKE